eukprot:TRINITY_DN27220_c0_g1_i1.p1 TRINITY_DN27220_c0_g1~~TRINITY_DN27220_c0_g1_i1.p1  ORF type:complete len:152 (+),score=47.62 TRINITY_DN27220_c0_g1_i1:53-457(+)
MAASAFIWAFAEKWNEAEFQFEAKDLAKEIKKRLLEVLSTMLREIHHVDTGVPQYYLLADILEPRKLAFEVFISSVKVWNFPEGSIHVTELLDNVHIEMPRFEDTDNRITGFPTSWTLESFVAGEGKVGYIIRI